MDLLRYNWNIIQKVAASQSAKRSGGKHFTWLQYDTDCDGAFWKLCNVACRLPVITSSRISYSAAQKCGRNGATSEQKAVKLLVVVQAFLLAGTFPILQILSTWSSWYSIAQWTWSKMLSVLNLKEHTVHFTHGHCGIHESSWDMGIGVHTEVSWSRIMLKHHGWRLYKCCNHRVNVHRMAHLRSNFWR